MIGRATIFPLVMVVLFSATLFHGYYLNNSGYTLTNLVERYPSLKSFVGKIRSLFVGNDGSSGGGPAGDERLFTAEELRQYDGTTGSPGLYLAIMGKVFDVEKGWQFYGPEGGYKQFTARDASRNFITGDFEEEDLTDNVEGLSDKDLLALDNWVQFYEKDYAYVGLLIGRFYDDRGKPMPALTDFRAAVERERNREKEEEAERQLYPGCNSEWADGKGGRVWCTTRSGGVERDWVGFPRRLFDPSSSDSRCVCVHESLLKNPNLREFEDCESTSVSCPLPMDDE